MEASLRSTPKYQIGDVVEVEIGEDEYRMVHFAPNESGTVVSTGFQTCIECATKANEPVLVTKPKIECDHIVGLDHEWNEGVYCILVIKKSDKEKSDKLENLDEEFNYCPECGEKLNQK